MSLKITCATPEAELAFLQQVGETDAANLPASLINFALSSPLVQSCEWLGGSIDVLVKDDQGQWNATTTENPVQLVQTGATVSFSDTKLKLLGLMDSPEFDAPLAENLWYIERIKNRYEPWVANPIESLIKYTYPTEVILVDSGVDAAHAEFVDADVSDLYVVPSLANDTTDTRGHGTALASLICGKTLGLAKSIKVKSVKVFGSTAITLGELIAALDAIIQYHLSAPGTVRIVNMSWLTVRDALVDEKIQEMLAAGMLVVAAAGNTGLNIDTISPAGVPGVVTVAASTENDAEYVPVYGVNRKLSLYAPGTNIACAKTGSVNKYVVASGSSLATALVSAIAAIVTQVYNTQPIATQLVTSLLRDATPSAVTVNENVTPLENKLLHDPRYAMLSSTTGFFYGAIGVGTSVNINTTAITRLNGFQRSFDSLSIHVAFPDSDQGIRYANMIVPDSNGNVTITLPADHVTPTGDLEPVQFQIVGTTAGIETVSPPIFFFAASAGVEVTESMVATAVDTLKSSGTSDLTQFIGITLAIKRK